RREPRPPNACATGSILEYTMGKRFVVSISSFVAGIAATLFLGYSLGVFAQLSERPGYSLSPPIESPKDLSGLSIKNPRIRIVHTKDPKLDGGSMYLQQVDPWLGYVWG